jgi:hypothetical protein
MAACSDLLVLEILRHHRCSCKVTFSATSIRFFRKHRFPCTSEWVELLFRCASSKVRPLFRRIASSFVALAIAWLSAAVAFGIYSRSANGAVLFLISSISVFAIAWILVGIPAVAAGRLLIQIPIWVVGLLGAVGGAIILFALDREDHLYRPEHLFGFPALASVSGAAGMVIYRLLIETRTKASL